MTSQPPWQMNSVTANPAIGVAPGEADGDHDQTQKRTDRRQHVQPGVLGVGQQGAELILRPTRPL
jgi:hypothetical protein